MARNKRYPSDWPTIALETKFAAMWRCESCHQEHDARGKTQLTVHHIDRNPANNEWWNLAALCRKCHGEIHRDESLMANLELMAKPWFRPHLAGMLGHVLLGKTLDRQEAIDNCDLYVVAMLTTIGPLILRGLRQFHSDEPGRSPALLAELQRVLDSLATLAIETGYF